MTRRVPQSRRRKVELQTRYGPVELRASRQVLESVLPAHFGLTLAAIEPARPARRVRCTGCRSTDVVALLDDDGALFTNCLGCGKSWR